MAGVSDEGEGPKDLFGDPWTPPRDPRGRKRHKRMPEVAEKVAVLRASGLTVDQIVGRIGLSEPTLRKYYLRELENGETLANAVLVEAMWKKAKSGSSAAARFVQERFEKGKAAIPVARRPTVKEERLGKKAQAEVDAATAHEGTGWGDLLGKPN